MPLRRRAGGHTRRGFREEQGQRSGRQITYAPHFNQFARLTLEAQQTSSGMSSSFSSTEMSRNNWGRIAVSDCWKRRSRTRLFSPGQVSERLALPFPRSWLLLNRIFPVTLLGSKRGCRHHKTCCRYTQTCYGPSRKRGRWACLQTKEGTCPSEKKRGRAFDGPPPRHGFVELSSKLVRASVRCRCSLSRPTQPTLRNVRPMAAARFQAHSDSSECQRTAERLWSTTTAAARLGITFQSQCANHNITLWCTFTSTIYSPGLNL